METAEQSQHSQLVLRHRKTVIMRRIFKVLACFVVALIIFNLGMYAGYRKAAFSYRWSDNYYQNFVGPSRLQPGRTMMPGAKLIDSHGLFGIVLKTGGNVMVIQDRDGAEKIVMVPETASIREREDALSLKDVLPGDKVVILGQPEDSSGQVTARLIRILPQDFGPREGATATQDVISSRQN